MKIIRSRIPIPHQGTTDEVCNWIIKTDQEAKDNPGKLVCVSPGFYIWYRKDEIVQVYRMTTGNQSTGEWIASTATWYSDPCPTLEALIESLEE